MNQFTGKKICGNIAIGKILYYTRYRAPLMRLKIANTEAELARYERAKAQAKQELTGLYQKAVKEVGEQDAGIFQAHIMLLEDEDYNTSVRDLILSQYVNAEYAVAATGNHFVELFAKMEDEFFHARLADVKDISERLISILNGVQDMSELQEPCIIVAEDLSPSEAIQLDKSKVLAFVTRQGSANSHTAILAKTMGIPALVEVDVQKEWNGRIAIVDGAAGKLILEPDDVTLESYKEKVLHEQRQKALLMDLKGKASITPKGQKMILGANIGNISDLEAVLENDADGIGLFRSEFLYLEKSDFPTEEEQFLVYKQVAEAMGGKKVIIRTLDMGADKQAAYLGLEQEENPAMGYRAIRICLTRPEIFKTQLRAIFRASAFGNIAVMYPLITSLEEVREIKEMVTVVQKELTEQGLSFGNVEQGIMIETPAAAIISDLLAKEVDFFSIGTNDLTQYTLAIDRQNSKLDCFYNGRHEAIMRLIKLTVDNAHKVGIPVGICGELGADRSLTEAFLQMGVDELSVSPGSILPIRKIVRETTV